MGSKMGWGYISKLIVAHKMMQFFLRVGTDFFTRDARVACSKTSVTPSFVFEEHSRYL